jgi:hypothetical protein
MLQGQVWAQFVVSNLPLGLISICYHADLSEKKTYYLAFLCNIHLMQCNKMCSGL